MNNARETDTGRELWGRVKPHPTNLYHIMWMLIALQVVIGVLIVSHPGEEARCVEELGRLYCNNPATDLGQ